ncbi:hypothetical protein ILUMI_13800 [Ignelater luminosus]|uniref:SH2 domain-containing protein n=1 Tax=Ignelater luminosus TaxID=2038154 RepID=A0A8K0CXS9_IGNLU|nr:hypothetical protein ILUMI_13800 [Ignelater luminosus]
MSQKTALLKQIENLNVNQLAEALEFNGYAECVGAIRSKNVDGQEFLKLTELNISLWRLPTVHARRLWSFIQQIKEDPKQFLMNIEKLTPKVNKSKFSPNGKPFVLEKPSNISNYFQKSVQLTGKDEMIQKEKTETSSSTLSKKESNQLKNKLELVFRKEASEVPNSSFVYSQRQPQLPPKPDYLKLENTENLEQSKQTEEEENDFNDGYLSPISKRKDNMITKENEKESSTGYENLEIRPQVIENKYEEQIVKPLRPVAQERPLPPIPKVEDYTRSFVPNVNHTTDDEELAHYAPVIDDETLDTTRKGNNEFLNSKQVLVCNTTTIDDEELAEYASVLEEEEEIKTPIAPISKNYNYHRPLPPVPVQFPPTANVNERPPVSIPTEDQKLTKFLAAGPTVTMQHLSAVKLKPRAVLPKSPNALPKFSNTLPKPPINLPKPPLEIVSPDLLLATQNDFASSSDEIHIQLRHSPIPLNVHSEQNPNMPEKIKDSFYTEIDLATLSCYRETDRRGARMLLSGLEDGAFLIRPSRQTEFVCTLSIMTGIKMYNLGVEKRSDGTFAFSTVVEDFQQPKLYSIGELIDYYSKTPMHLSGKYITLKNILPQNRH